MVVLFTKRSWRLSGSVPGHGPQTVRVARSFDHKQSRGLSGSVPGHDPRTVRLISSFISQRSPRQTRSQRRSPPKVGASRVGSKRAGLIPLAMLHGEQSPCSRLSRSAPCNADHQHPPADDMSRRRRHPRISSKRPDQHPLAILHGERSLCVLVCLGELCANADHQHSPANSLSRRRQHPRIISEWSNSIRSPSFMASNLCVLVCLGELCANADHQHPPANSLSRGRRHPHISSKRPDQHPLAILHGEQSLCSRLSR